VCGSATLSGTSSQLILRKPFVKEPPVPLFPPPRATELRKPSTAPRMSDAEGPDAVVITAVARALLEAATCSARAMATARPRRKFVEVVWHSRLIAWLAGSETGRAGYNDAPSRNSPPLSPAREGRG
jgi:hypothetical protein